MKRRVATAAAILATLAAGGLAAGCGGSSDSTGKDDSSAVEKVGDVLKEQLNTEQGKQAIQELQKQMEKNGGDTQKALEAAKKMVDSGEAQQALDAVRDQLDQLQQDSK